ncbi:MAG: Gx transporter family protein [Collinsella sp.]
MVNIEHARRLARVSLLCACALVLSYLETMIPLPVAVPGIKLGLANVAVVVALYTDVKAPVLRSSVLHRLFGSPMMSVIAQAARSAFIGMVALLLRWLGAREKLAAVLQCRPVGRCRHGAADPGSLYQFVPALPPAPGGITGAVAEGAPPVLNKPMTHVPPSIAPTCRQYRGRRAHRLCLPTQRQKHLCTRAAGCSK